MGRLHRRILTLGVMVVAVAAGQVVYGVDDLLRGRVTSYSATCLVKIADNRCTAVGRTLDPSVFQVSVERQQVDSFVENGERVSFRSCAVTSKADWHCRSSDGSSEFGFSSGRPWHRIQGADAPDLVFLPRWQYLWLESGETHRDLPSRFHFR